jgi:phage terminase large subunit-like protein
MNEVGYDSYNATQYVIKAEEEGLPMVAYSQTLSSFNKPTKFFEMLVRSEKCIIEANPAVEWCLANVELMFDHYENCKPTKANGEKNNKIDPVISMLEALGCYLNSKNFSPEAWTM